MEIFKMVENYSFSYSGEMDNALKSLPLGNGDVGVNVWLASDKKLHLLVSKSDSWSELYRLIKPAYVVLDINPCPFIDGADFTLSIADGVLSICKDEVSIKVYVDAFSPCIRVDVQSKTPRTVKAEFINYRTAKLAPNDPSNNFANGLMGVEESVDLITPTKNGGIAQIHHNNDSCYIPSLRHQDMEFYIGKESDPLLNRTFGAGIYSSDMVVKGESLVANQTTKVSLSIFVKTEFCKNFKQYAKQIDKLYLRYGNATEESYENHVNSWREFWEKSYVFVQSGEHAYQITRAFLYQRYITRCADRGAPIRFNGSLFTAKEMQNYPGNYDARKWGSAYWFQNTRIIYWYMLYVGDYSAMLPMFDMYINMMPIARARCEHFFGHEGILIPETVSFFGLYSNGNYGIKNEQGIRTNGTNKAIRRGEPCNPYIRYHYNGMLELSWMMLKYLQVSGDNSRREKMLEFIEQTLQFFNRHFYRDNGKLVLNPVSSLEMWAICVNDLPDVAGLNVVCNALSKMQNIPKTLEKLVQELLPEIPDIPTESGKDGQVLSPCEIKITKEPQNVENPELYAVFPFELYGINKPDLELAVCTYFNRANKLDGGWSQDPAISAMLGLTEEAMKHVVRQVDMVDENALFPAFFGPNADETPDQDHGCMTALSIIFMLLQNQENGYVVFPAWPKEWNVRFRLPVDDKLFIYGEQVDGERKVREERV